MGTPHFGADLASWGRFGTNMASILKRTNADIVAVLEPGSEMLAGIQKGFHSILRLRKDEDSQIEITCFYEELSLPIIGEVILIPLYFVLLNFFRLSLNTRQFFQGIAATVYMPITW